MHPLSKLIKKFINSDVHIVDTGLSICNQLKTMFRTYSFNKCDNSINEYYVSDLPYRFNDLASKFLNQEIHHVEQVQL